MAWLKSPCMMCWFGVLSRVCRNPVTCVRISWLLFALSWSKCMEVKSMVVCVSVAGCSSRAPTVRACHANFVVSVSGVNDIV